jgi:FkbM family methyltransferase
MPTVATHREPMPVPDADPASAYALWPMVTGLSMLARADPTEAIAFHLSGGDVVCPGGLLDMLRNAANEGRHETLLDIGSNIGSCSIEALRLGHTTIAVEPTPENVRMWRANALLNEELFSDTARAFLIPYAVSDAAGVATLHHDARNTGNAMVEAAPDAGAERSNLFKGADPVNTEEICILALDGIASGDDDAFAELRAALRAATLIKIDIQGHEGLAVRGMKLILADATRARAIFVEVSPSVSEVKGVNTMELYRAFTDLGFAFLHFDTEAKLRAQLAGIKGDMYTFIDLEAMRDVPSE